MSYCKTVESMPVDSPHIRYHNEEYGFPLKSDNELFGRLILEINQAGLSWTTILNKADNFREAYSDFSVEKVAAYSEKDRKRLLQNAGIIRNKLKVNAAIHKCPNNKGNAEKPWKFQKIGWMENIHFQRKNG